MELEIAQAGKKKDEKKRKGRTIREYVASRRPDFDTTQHQVVVNDVTCDEANLDLLLGPLDWVKIIPKA